MEKVAKRGASEQRDLMIKQLIEGLEAAKQLQERILISQTKAHHNPQLEKDNNDDDETLINHSLLDKMLSSFDKAISIAKLINIELQRLPLNDHQQQPSNNEFHFEGSPTHSLALSSPTSENSHHQLHLSKKRKMMPRWSKTVNVGVGVMISGLEGALNDGFCWRKYGQKDILKAKFPRGYYRCTHRHTQDCQATKQVQRSDEDPTTYQVIYRGEHTCTPEAQQPKAQSKPKKAQLKPEQNPQSLESPQEQEVYLGLGPNETLKIELTQNESPAHIFRSFSFKSAQLDSGPIDNFLFGCSPTFGSPATSEFNYFPLSAYRVTAAGAGLNVQTSESDLNGSISGPSSVSNSPMGCDFEFPIDELLDIDAIFPNFEF